MHGNAVNALIRPAISQDLTLEEKQQYIEARKPQPLNDKQTMFCREYLRDFNCRDAAIRAGYKKESAHSTASKLLNDSRVRDEIERLMVNRGDRIDVGVDYTLMVVKETIERARQNVRPLFDRSGHPVMALDADGNEIGQAYAFDGDLVLKGAALLGKHNGAFRDRLEVEDRNLSRAMELLADEQLDDETMAQKYVDLMRR